MQIEAGKFYRTRDGRKVGPMVKECARSYDWSGAEGEKGRIYREGGAHGGSYVRNIPDLDIVAEWQDEPTGPVRTVTRREIVPGVYGIVHVWKQEGVGLCFSIAGRPHSADELRSAAMVLSQLAEALDDNKDA